MHRRFRHGEGSKTQRLARSGVGAGIHVDMQGTADTALGFDNNRVQSVSTAKAVAAAIAAAAKASTSGNASDASGASSSPPTTSSLSHAPNLAQALADEWTVFAHTEQMHNDAEHALRLIVKDLDIDDWIFTPRSDVKAATMTTSATGVEPGMPGYAIESMCAAANASSTLREMRSQLSGNRTDAFAPVAVAAESF